MRVLIVDNKDSFSYNLKHYINHFCDDIHVVRCDKLDLQEVSSYDKVMFSPGPGLPKEYPILTDILNKYAAVKSIFGICLGQQVIAEFYGAKLENLYDPMHGTSSKVKHFRNCNLYKDIPLEFSVGHYHSWVVSSEDFPEDLEITAVNQNGLLMSLKHKKHDVKSVQFHPESILTENGLLLIKNWIFN